MAYKPKNKVQDEILDVIKNKTTVKKGAIHIDGHKLPDPKAHQIVSFIKSTIRIVGYIAIPFNLELATALLISSEIVGILEELV